MRVFFNLVSDSLTSQVMLVATALIPLPHGLKKFPVFTLLVSDDIKLLFIGIRSDAKFKLGPKGRDVKNIYIIPEFDDWTLGPSYYTKLEAGQEFALMFVLSVGKNKTQALSNAAEIDTEPDYIFHGTLYY